MNPDYTSFLGLIPPAIAISVLAYLARFFGKAIEDQNPFADDRKWSIELSGVMFMVNMAWGLVGFAFAISKPWGIEHTYLHFFTAGVLALIAGSFYLNNIYEGHRIFKANTGIVKSLDEKMGRFPRWYAGLSKYLGISTLSMVLFYFGTLEWLSHDLSWIVFSYTAMFFLFVFSALNFSYKKFKTITPVEVHFCDASRPPLTNVRILKVNEDNVRLRADDRILIINKSEIFKIEMPIPPEML